MLENEQTTQDGQLIITQGSSTQLAATTPLVPNPLHISAIEAIRAGNDVWLSLLLGLPYGLGKRFFEEKANVISAKQQYLFLQALIGLKPTTKDSIKTFLQEKLNAQISEEFLFGEERVLLKNLSNGWTFVLSKSMWEAANNSKLDAFLETFKTATLNSSVQESEINYSNLNTDITKYISGYKMSMTKNVYKLFNANSPTIPEKFRQAFQQLSDETSKKNYINELYGSVPINLTDSSKQSLLYIALQNKQIDIACGLIGAGADLFQYTDKEDTPIHYALANFLPNSDEHAINVYNKLMQAIKNVLTYRGKEVVNIYNGQNQTVLHLIMQHQNNCLLESVIALGADFYARDDKNKTPAGIAYATGYKNGATLHTFCLEIGLINNPLMLSAASSTSLIIKSSADPGLHWLTNVHYKLDQFYVSYYKDPPFWRKSIQIFSQPNEKIKLNVQDLQKTVYTAVYAAQPDLAYEKLAALHAVCEQTADSYAKDLAVILKSSLDNYQTEQTKREPASPVKKRLKDAENRAKENEQKVANLTSALLNFSSRLDQLEKVSQTNGTAPAPNIQSTNNPN